MAQRTLYTPDTTNTLFMLHLIRTLHLMCITRTIKGKNGIFITTLSKSSRLNNF